VKRLALTLLGLFGILVASCAPAPSIVTNVPVTLISVSTPAVKGDVVVLQGRYFGDGRTGGEAANYVLVGANAEGSGGQKVTVVDWSPTRISFVAPESGGNGWVFVTAGGIRSNGLPTNLP